MKLLNVLLLLNKAHSATHDVWSYTVTNVIPFTAVSTNKKPIGLLIGNQDFSPMTTLSCVIQSKSIQLTLISYKISGLLKNM